MDERRQLAGEKSRNKKLKEMGDKYKTMTVTICLPFTHTHTQLRVLKGIDVDSAPRDNFLWRNMKQNVIN